MFQILQPYNNKKYSFSKPIILSLFIIFVQCDKLGLRNRQPEISSPDNNSLSENQPSNPRINIDEMIELAENQHYIFLAEKLRQFKANASIKDINDKNAIDNNKTALYYAATLGSLEIVQLLLAHKDGGSLMINHKAKNGATAIHQGILTEHNDVAELLINHPDCNINIKGDKGFTLLHTAAQMGNLAVIQLLIKKGAKVDEKNDSGMTPVATVLAQVKLPEHAIDIIKILLADKADDQVKNLKKEDLSIPFYWAVFRGNAEIVQILLDKGAHINAQANMNKSLTPLHTATIQGHTAIVKLLLQKADINILLKESENLYTALHIAVRKGFPAIVKALLNHKDAKANLQEKDKAKNTPINYNTTEAIKKILEDKAKEFGL